MTAQEERIVAVLEGRLPDEALSSDDIALLEQKLNAAIAEKFNRGHVKIIDGKPETIQ